MNCEKCGYQLICPCSPNEDGEQEGNCCMLLIVNNYIRDLEWTQPMPIVSRETQNNIVDTVTPNLSYLCRSMSFDTSVKGK